MIDFNTTTISGRLTRDPELRQSNEGKPICTISIAVNGYQDRVSYIDCVAFGKVAELIHQYVTKGQSVMIQGVLSQNRWEDQNGQKRSKIEIIIDKINFGSKPHGANQQQDQQPDQPPDQPPSDDDMPF